MYHAFATAAVATNSPSWVYVGNRAALTIQTRGITTATVKVYGSNREEDPGTGVNDVQIGADITADGIVRIEGPYRWIKAKITAWTAGTLYVEMQAN